MFSDYPAALTCQTEGSLCIPHSCAASLAPELVPLFWGPQVLNQQGTARPFYSVKRPALQQQKGNLIWPLTYSRWTERKGGRGLSCQEGRCRKLRVLHLLTFKHFFLTQGASSVNILHAKRKKNKNPQKRASLFSRCYDTSKQAAVWVSALHAGSDSACKLISALSWACCLFNVTFAEEDHLLSATSPCSWGTDSPAGTHVSHHLSRSGQN